MDQRIFNQLDQLQRGARQLAPARPSYNSSNTAYIGSREAAHYRNDHDQYDASEELYGDENLDPGSYNEPFRQARPSQYSQYLGTPSELYGGAGQVRTQESGRMNNAATDVTRFDLTRFALGNEGVPSSSPGAEYPQQSSPSFHASQRRPTAKNPTILRGAPRWQEKHEPSLQSHHGRYASSDLREDDTRRPALRSNHRIHEEDPAPPAAPKQRQTTDGHPIVQGIRLVSTHDLPDRFRSIFPFPLFNAVQSKCFSVIYHTNDNFVLSSPTGSGKTAVLELAICRLMNGFANGTYKVVYQAPTKSLCSERQRDWQAKFAPFDLQVAELTGDTDLAQTRNVQHASVIITTPEKWDSMTRKWKDHVKLMQMVKLFLIDEVHILKEDRGATLEAIVSRMKSIGSDLRFVALSNDFAFEKKLNAKLPDVIMKWSKRKPIMVFCFTRNACLDTAKSLSNWWASRTPRDRYWEAPRQRLVVEDKDLRETIPSAVAFHHAGLSIVDRNTVERGYLDGDINVICCTSTLAVGVNLPCHMVIIKGTVTYQGNGNAGMKEYSDLETMQMLGRAGRPQFDDSAVAVIMTKLQMIQQYEKMVTGQETLESCLHRNFLDHLNAEIGLGTITNVSSAKKWLSGTFLYVRLKEHPEHYQIDGDSSSSNLDERLEAICSKGIAQLEQYDLVHKAQHLQCTDFGDAMARYYIQFDTMKILLALPAQAKTSEVLSAVAQATEYKDIRFRAGEKPTYKELNKNSSIKFPIPVNLDAPAHKVSLVIQAVLGAIDFPSQDYKQKTDFSSSKNMIFQNVQRLISCVIDCSLFLEDSVTARNALALSRSLGAQAWDDSPLHLRQLDGVGLVTVRKLATAGIRTMEDVENAEQHRLEHLLSRNPPYGAQLQEKARAFPKLRVSLRLVGEPVTKQRQHVVVRLCAEVRFLNTKVPELFNRKHVYVCLLAEISDGHVLHFARVTAKKLNQGKDFPFAAHITKPSQTIRVFVMCSEIAGSLQEADLKPDIHPSIFSSLQVSANVDKVSHAPNIMKRRAEALPKRKRDESEQDEFGDAGIDDNDLALAEDGAFANIDDFDAVEPSTTTASRKPAKQPKRTEDPPPNGWSPRQLENGKWACNHACKDKSSCKHLCCREGLDKKPKPPRAKEVKKTNDRSPDPKQTQLNMTSQKPGMPKTKGTSHSNALELERATGKANSQVTKATGKQSEDLDRLNNSVQHDKRTVPTLSRLKKTAERQYPGLSRETQHYDSFASSSDYGDTRHLDDVGEPAIEQADAHGTSLRLQDNDLGLDSDEMLDVDSDFPAGAMTDWSANNEVDAGEEQIVHRQDQDDGVVVSNALARVGQLGLPRAQRSNAGIPAEAPVARARQPFLAASSDSSTVTPIVLPGHHAGRTPAQSLPYDQAYASHDGESALQEPPDFEAVAPNAKDPLNKPSGFEDDSYRRPEPEELHGPSSQEARDWFTREFGMEGFNFVG